MNGGRRGVVQILKPLGATISTNKVQLSRRVLGGGLKCPQPFENDKLIAEDEKQDKF